MSKKILVVDDDRTNVRIIQARLEKEGFFVNTAYDGESGLNKVKSGHPDIIILDIEMPEMDGYSFVLELRKIQKSMKTPVIIQTSHKEMKPIFALNKVSHYMTKPLNVNELVEKIKDCFKDEN